MPDPPLSWRDRLAMLPAALPSLPPRALAIGGGLASLAVAVVLAVVVLRGSAAPPELVLPRAVPSAGGAAGAPGGAGRLSSDDATAAYVHVAGAVARPGVYRVGGRGRVADVLDAAGGPQPDADLDQVNLAAKVTDGERVYLPRRGEVAPVPAAGTGGAVKAEVVNLNTATAEELDALPGVGPATAAAILDYRRQHGPFRSVDDLVEVRGIGEAKLEALRSRARV